MNEIRTIGLDLAKHVFQVHGIDAQGTAVLRKRLRRGQMLAFFSRIPRWRSAVRCHAGVDCSGSSKLLVAETSRKSSIWPPSGHIFISKLCGES